MARDVSTAPRPRLLVLTPSADLYGSDRALLLALPRIVERFDVVLLSAEQGPMLRRAAALGARVEVSADWALRRRGLRPAAIPGTLVRAVRGARLIRRLHREAPFDLVYANTVANALMPALPRLVDRRLVVHVREVPRDRGRLARALFRAVDRTADLVLCNSRFTADLVARLAPGLSDRLRVVPDGIEPLTASAEPAADDVLDVVCVGRIHPKKGHAVLLEATRIAAESGRIWRLHLWGDALPEHRELHQRLLRQAERAGIADRVLWHGFSADTERMYRGMDVAVVPSVLPEEFSLVTAEAQMTGLPVVATGPGGPSDILREGETGLIVPPDDAPALAGALMRVEDLPDRRAWGAAGRRRVIERFTVARYAPAVAAELEGALAIE